MHYPLGKRLDILPHEMLLNWVRIVIFFQIKRGCNKFPQAHNCLTICEAVYILLVENISQRLCITLPQATGHK